MTKKENNQSSPVEIKEIEKFIKDNLKLDDAQFYNKLDETYADKNIQVIQTGGGIMVGIIPIDKRNIIGITNENLVKYTVNEDMEPLDIFYDDNATHEVLYEVKKKGGTSKDKWYQKAVEENYPNTLKGWSKNLPSAQRREKALSSRRKNLSRDRRYLSAGRALQALANVTKDKETKAAAQADAKYFFDKLDRKKAKGGVADTSIQSGIDPNNPNVPEIQVYYTIAKATPVHRQGAEIIIHRKEKPIVHAHGHYYLYDVYIKDRPGHEYWKVSGVSYESAKKAAEDIKSTIEAGYQIAELSKA